MRVKNGLKRHQRHKKFRKLAEGFRLGRKNVYKQIRLALIKQGINSYIGRKLKKRDQRKLWIVRLNAALRNRGSKYSVFIGKMNSKNIYLNRKILSNISIAFPKVFNKIYDYIMA